MYEGAGAPGYVRLTYTISGSQVKWYNGATWVLKPLKRYNGSTWVPTTLKRYNGATWTTV